MGTSHSPSSSNYGNCYGLISEAHFHDSIMEGNRLCPCAPSDSAKLTPCKIYSSICNEFQPLSSALILTNLPQLFLIHAVPFCIYLTGKNAPSILLLRISLQFGPKSMPGLTLDFDPVSQGR